MTSSDSSQSDYEYRIVLESPNGEFLPLLSQGADLDGAMPTGVRERFDSDSLWTAFRRHVGIAWTGQRVDDFVAGWDAARRTGLTEDFREGRIPW